MGAPEQKEYDAEMVAEPLADVFNVSRKKGIAEVGGSHADKGRDFQRYWSVLRMFELEKSGEKDFLLLFKAIEDVAILDSESAPTAICIYQIKKKDRKEWSWVNLTNLHNIPVPSSKKRTSASKPAKTTKPKKTNIKPLTEVSESPLGKLYIAVRAITKLTSTGQFVSNSGCDVPLGGGHNAATSLPITLTQLSPAHRQMLSDALETLHDPNESPPDLSRIRIERALLHVDDLDNHLIGLAHKFLEDRSPRHAGQARSLVESLLATVGPLGRNTNTCHNFD